MVNSNFYGIDAILMHPTKVQAARAATVIHTCLLYRRFIDRQELEPVSYPFVKYFYQKLKKIFVTIQYADELSFTYSIFQILIQGLVPLCSWQYERLFNTTRVPGVETDRIVHYADSNHIVVYHRGRYFKVIIYHRNRLLQPCELEMYVIKPFCIS